jgi:hypothetical protein
MNKALIALIALMLIAGAAYAAADSAKKIGEPVTTVVESAGTTVEGAAEGTIETLNLEKNNPITTAVNTTAKTAENTVKTATFQKVEKTDMSCAK